MQLFLVGFFMDCVKILSPFNVLYESLRSITICCGTIRFIPFGILLVSISTNYIHKLFAMKTVFIVPPFIVKIFFHFHTNKGLKNPLFDNYW